MAIIRWRPWDLSSFLSDDFDLPTIPGLSRLGQGLNIYETEDTVVAEAALPGVPEDRIDITVDDGIVRISGSMREKEEEKGKRRYYMSSISSSYNYAFRLPEGLKDEEPVVELENGILRMVFPKMEKVPPKKIQITAKKKGEKGGEAGEVRESIRRQTRTGQKIKVKSVGR